MTGFAGRAVQLARVAVAARGVRRAKDEVAREAARRALAAIMADARGLPMKIGQMLAGPTGDGPFQMLVNGVEPLPLGEILPLLGEALERPPETIFTAFDLTGMAASLGQVHRAVLRDGTEVAVKVRYPGIARAVGAELRLAGLLPALGPVRRYAFDLEAYKRTLCDDLERELDYRSEARRQARFRQQVRVDGLAVPRIFPGLCGDGVLVQSWERGVRLAWLETWPLRDRLLVARTLLITFFKSLFVHGELHADPNPGNYLYRRSAAGSPEVVLLDFGCTLALSEPRRLALLQLVLSLREGAPADPLRSLAALGFDAAKLGLVSDALPEITAILLEPFLVDRPYRTWEWGLRERLAARLGDLRWWFRAAGPPDLLLLLRAVQGLHGQLRALQAALPWWPLLAEAVGEDLLARARAFVPPELPPGAVPPAASARLLRVRISERGREVIAVALPALQALELESAIPSPVQDRLLASGADLPAIQGRVRASGIRPQEIFALESGARSYRVWLE